MSMKKCYIRVESEAFSGKKEWHYDLCDRCAKFIEDTIKTGAKPEQPTAEAVEVVRCAECKHCFDAGPDPMVPYDGEDVWHCEMWGREASAYQVDPYRFFCARGERRNGVAAAFFATSE